MKAPKLKKIDLKKCCSLKASGDFHDHPDIKSNKIYLAKIEGRYYAGRFSKQWYGWKFDGAGLQLDKPGANCSMWQGLWEIVG